MPVAVPHRAASLNADVVLVRLPTQFGRNRHLVDMTLTGVNRRFGTGGERCSVIGVYCGTCYVGNTKGDTTDDARCLVQQLLSLNVGLPSRGASAFVTELSPARPLCRLHKEGAIQKRRLRRQQALQFSCDAGYLRRRKGRAGCVTIQPGTSK